MTSRERFFCTLSHKEPDRIPYNARLVPNRAEALEKHLGIFVPYYEHFCDDIVFAGRILPWGDFPEPFDIYTDEIPLPESGKIADVTKQIALLKSQDKVVANSYTPGVFEHVKSFLGDEETLIKMYTEPEKLHSIIDKISTWHCKLYEAYASMGLDIVWMGDDLGTQRSLIMSLDDYRLFYKPHHVKIISTIKAVNPDIKVAFHCCGCVEPLVPELIEIGVDILETVQPEAKNDLAFLKKEYGQRLTFWGGIGTQSLFFDKTPDEVKDGVRSPLKIMSADGGYIAAPCHTITEEVRVENIIAFYEAIEAFGGYPFPGK